MQINNLVIYRNPSNKQKFMLLRLHQEMEDLLLEEPKDGKEGTLAVLKNKSWLNLSYEQAVALKEKFDKSNKVIETLDTTTVTL